VSDLPEQAEAPPHLQTEPEPNWEYLIKLWLQEVAVDAEQASKVPHLHVPA